MTKDRAAFPYMKLALGGVVAGALLIGFVLPAEYGVDPTGLGRVTGLTALAQEAPASGATAALAFNVEDYDPQAERIERSIQGLIHLEDAPFKSEVIELQIEDFGEIEHKFILPADTSFVYAWEVVDPKGDGVYFEFHGHPSSADAASYPEGFEMAYSKGEGVAQNGSFTAPFPGYHGWYFMNLEEGPITLRLTVAGYWSEHKEMYRAVNGEVLNSVEF